MTWTFSTTRVLRLVANLGREPVMHEGPEPSWGRRVYTTGLTASRWAELPLWSVGWFLWEGEP
jgi:Domain of unknown function (DUF3459)